MANPPGIEATRLANSLGCLAAQMVGHFKNDVGGIYLHPPHTQDVGQDYAYHITREEGHKIHIRVVEYGKEVGVFTPEELIAYVERAQEQEGGKMSNPTEQTITLLIWIMLILAVILAFINALNIPIVAIDPYGEEAEVEEAELERRECSLTDLPDRYTKIYVPIRSK